MAASQMGQMGQMGQYYGPAAAYGSLSAASMAAAAAAAAAQQNSMSGLGTPAQVSILAPRRSSSPPPRPARHFGRI